MIRAVGLEEHGRRVSGYFSLTVFGSVACFLLDVTDTKHNGPPGSSNLGLWVVEAGGYLHADSFYAVLWTLVYRDRTFQWFFRVFSPSDEVSALM